MNAIIIKTEENEFFFSDKTKEYSVLKQCAEVSSITNVIQDIDLTCFFSCVEKKMEQLLQQISINSHKEKLSRIIRIDFRGLEYELNLSDSDHLLFYNLFLINSALINLPDDRALIRVTYSSE